MKIKWDNKYISFGLTAFIVIICSIFFSWLLNNWTSFYNIITIILKAISPVIIGLFIAVLLDKPVQVADNYIFAPYFSKDPYYRPSTKKSRISAIIFVQFVTWFFVFGLISLVFPQIYRSIIGLISNANTYANNAINWAEKMLINNPQLKDYAENAINNILTYLNTWSETSLLPLITGITGGIIIFVKGILNLLIGIVVSIYLLVNKDTFLAQCKKFLYGSFSVKHANIIISFFEDVNKSFGGFFSGKIIDSIIVGIISYIVLTILKMPYSALVSLIVGVTNIIPVFGPFIGAIPSAIIILFESPVQCLIFILFILILQQFDGNVLGPRILGNSIGLSGFWIMFSILLFGNIFGFMGMLLGVPIFAVVYNIVKNITAANLEEKGLPAETSYYKNVEKLKTEPHNDEEDL